MVEALLDCPRLNERPTEPEGWYRPIAESNIPASRYAPQLLFDRKSRSKQKLHVVGGIKFGRTDRHRLQSVRGQCLFLDSNFEIALKEFIVHRHDLFPPSSFGDAALQKLFRNRGDVIDLIEKTVTIPPSLISRSKHYYAMRNKLIHERATVHVTDSDIENYREATQKVMKILFGLRFSA